MLARQQRKARKNPAELARAKAILKARGWAYRSAAPLLKVHFTHLCLVLTGKRVSRALLKRIEEIPQRSEQTHAA